MTEKEKYQNSVWDLIHELERILLEKGTDIDDIEKLKERKIYKVK